MVHLSPDVLIVTTPNAEFNRVFDALHVSPTVDSHGPSHPATCPSHTATTTATATADTATSTATASSTTQATAPSRRFRHHDHKFEWSRAEFSQWFAPRFSSLFHYHSWCLDFLFVYRSTFLLDLIRLLILSKFLFAKSRLSTCKSTFSYNEPSLYEVGWAANLIP